MEVNGPQKKAVFRGWGFTYISRIHSHSLHTIDGSNPAPVDRVVYPIIYSLFNIPGVFFLMSSINVGDDSSMLGT